MESALARGELKLQKESYTAFIDAFVDSLDLAGAGFERAEPKETPAPGVRSLRLAEAVHLRVSEPGGCPAVGWRRKPTATWR